MNNVTKIAKIKTETDSETEPDDLTAKIRWKSYETRVIDLKVMCENDVDIIWKDEPSPSHHISDTLKAVDDPASADLEKSDLKENVKVKKPGSGRKMFCKYEAIR